MYKLDYTISDINYLAELYLKKGFPLYKYIKYMTYIYILFYFTIWISDLSVFTFACCIFLLVILMFYKPIVCKIMKYSVGKTIEIDLNYHTIIDNKNKKHSINRKLSFIDVYGNIVIFKKRNIFNVPYLIKPALISNKDFNILSQYAN